MLKKNHQQQKFFSLFAIFSIENIIIAFSQNKYHFKTQTMTTEKIRLISEEIVEIRKEIKTCESILNRSAQMYDNTKEAERTEERMVEDAGSRNRNAACRTRSKDNA